MNLECVHCSCTAVKDDDSSGEENSDEEEVIGGESVYQVPSSVG